MPKKSVKSRAVTDEEISKLSVEASRAGDTAMVKICGRALSGSAPARKECSRVILAARAMAD